MLKLNDRVTDSPDEAPTSDNSGTVTELDVRGTGKVKVVFDSGEEGYYAESELEHI